MCLSEFMCIMCASIQVSTVARRDCWIPLELYLQAIVANWMWVLGATWVL